MNDLLNEEEFLYADSIPKKWFLLIYLAGIVLTALIPTAEYLFKIEITDTSAIIIAVAMLLIPLLLSMVMILSGKNVILKLSLGNAALKIFTMHACCYLSFGCFLVTKMVIDDEFTMNNFYGGLAVLGLYLFIYLVTIAIILPILKRSQRIIKKLPQ
jgi:hypothetical protein